ncbi:MAG: acetylglutamate kinase [Oscillospiraceae bacterium]
MYNNACDRSMNIRNRNLTNEFRKLWEQHIMWTRSFIISTASDLPDLQLVTKRLLKNPNDFSNLLSQFYGKYKADEFEKLFTDHLIIAATLVNHAKSGNSNGVEQTRKQWYSNADDIAILLSSINPFWSFSEWQSLLYDHLKMTEDEAVYRLTGNYDADIVIYDTIEDEALKMADLMAAGTKKYFCF